MLNRMVSFECIQDLIKNIDSEKFSPDIFFKNGPFYYSKWNKFGYH